MNFDALTLVHTLDLPEATPSNNTIKGMHYRVYAKARNTWQFMVQGAVAGSGVMQGKAAGPRVPLERAFLHITRYSAGGGLDWDNAYGGLKPLLDCLVCASDRNPDGLGLIRDDAPRHMPLPPFIVQLPAKRGEGRTVVKIYDAAALDVSTLGGWLH